MFERCCLKSVLLSFDTAPVSQKPTISTQNALQRLFCCILCVVVCRLKSYSRVSSWLQSIVLTDMSIEISQKSRRTYAKPGALK